MPRHRPRAHSARGRPGSAIARTSQAIGLAAALCGCATPVVVPPAPYASDPACGVVLQRAPVELLGLERRPTTSQSSRAWGGTEPIVLRCGVEPPGPSTERCVRITDDDGEVIDWIALEAQDAWAFVTYGRVPAIEVIVPVAALAGDGQPTAPLIDLGRAVSVTTVESTCL